jgi:hypothetical protein
VDLEFPRWFQIVALVCLLATSVGCLVWGIVGGDWVKFVAAVMPLPLAAMIVWMLRNGVTQPFNPEQP